MHRRFGHPRLKPRRRVSTAPGKIVLYPRDSPPTEDFVFLLLPWSTSEKSK